MTDGVGTEQEDELVTPKLLLQTRQGTRHAKTNIDILEHAKFTVRGTGSLEHRYPMAEVLNALFAAGPPFRQEVNPIELGRLNRLQRKSHVAGMHRVKRPRVNTNPLTLVFWLCHIVLLYKTRLLLFTIP